jgi:hypothetical protein
MVDEIVVKSSQKPKQEEINRQTQLEDVMKMCQSLTILKILNEVGARRGRFNLINILQAAFALIDFC